MADRNRRSAESMSPGIHPWAHDLHGFTTWLSIAETLELKLPLPWYMDLMGCVPTVSADVVNVARCVVAFTLPVPSTVVPSLNVTVPSGEPPKVPRTLAVKVTAFPWWEGLSDELRVIVVFALFTVCARGDEALVRKLPSPP